MNIKKLLPLVLALLVLTSACSMINPSASANTDGQGGTPSYRATVPAPTLDDGVCIDPTTSTPGPFAANIQQIVANTLATWTGSVPPATVNTATQPQPGVTMVVRQVETNSYLSSNVDLNVTVPSVPGLIAPPAVTSQAFLTDDPIWLKGRSAVVAAATAAQSSGAKAAQSVTSMQLESWQNSDIVGCVSALASTMPPGNRRLLLASDLQQNEPPQVGGSLTGTEVLVVQPCNTDASSCTGWADLWQELLTKAGASSVRFVRPEDASEDIPPFLRGAS